jgi:molybdopterin converting factor small subunit
MATTIKIPAPLRVYTSDQSEISVEGATVKDALNSLLTSHPDLRPHLFNGEELRNFVNIFVGEEDIRYRDGLETPLEPGEKLRIIPTIAGGTDVRGNRR